MSKRDSFASAETGSYGEAGSLAQSVLVNGSGNPLIDGVLSGVKWNALTLTVQFPGAAADYGPNYGQGEPNSFLAITQAQANAFNWASVLVRDYTRLDLVPGNSTNANLRMANFTAPDGTSHGYYPDGFPTMGDTWMGSHNNNFAGPITNPQAGDFNFATHLHEFGHALGLKHGHQAGILGAGMAKQPDGTIIPNYGALPANFDNWNYSIMTYRSYSGAAADPVQGFLTSDNPITYMPADILALQYMYGPEYGGTSSGNTTYRWDTNGFYSVNGVVQLPATANGKMLMTVWDGGGIDTYDFSLHSANQYVDLRPGAFSTFNPAQLADLDRNTPGVQPALGNVANAFLFNNDPRSLIENAIAGSGNDLIIGNAANNVLTGNAGNDVITGLGGIDDARGGPGNDTYVLEDAGDTVTELPGEGNDIVFTYVDLNMPANVEVIGLYGAADFAKGNDGDNTLIGGALPDTLSGEGGNDQVWGLAGNDTLSGGPGNDVLIGGDGTNSMSGGAGDDQYIISSSADQITEAAGQGNEIVWSSASYILPANVETLALLYTGAPINGLGNDQANTIIGTATDNVLYGNGGNDYLIGGFGNDGFVGGFGNDTLNLGPGSDYIVFGSPHDDYDFVLDFQSIDDAFVLNGANFGFAPGSAPTLGFNLFINSNPKFTTPSFAYNTTTGIMTFDYDGGGTGAIPLQIVALTNHPAIDVSDFVFV